MGRLEESRRESERFFERCQTVREWLGIKTKEDAVAFLAGKTNRPGTVFLDAKRTADK